MCARSQTSGDWSGEIWRVSCSSESGSSRSSVRRRARSRATTSSDGDTELGEAGEDERGDHRAFSNRDGHALRRALADVARGEEPYAARLERQRIAIERPAVGRVARSEEVLSGQDVAGGIGEDVLARTPVGVWAPTYAEEDGVHRALLGFARRIGEARGRDLVTVRVQLGQLRLQMEVDQWVLFDPLDQVGRHRRPEAVPAHEHGHACRRVREVEHGLAGRIAGAHDDDALTSALGCLAAAGAVIDAVAEELVDAV